MVRSNPADASLLRRWSGYPSRLQAAVATILGVGVGVCGIVVLTGAGISPAVALAIMVPVELIFIPGVARLMARRKLQD
jgi:hypothetical protein